MEATRPALSSSRDPAPDKPDGRLRADARRERILTVAGRLFAKRGFRNVSVRDIAREARVTHPLIYYYWRSKEDLLAETVARSQARVRRAGTGEQEPLDAILSMVVETLEHNRQYLQTLTRALLDGMPPAQWPGGYPGVATALQLLETDLDPAGPDAREARERLAFVVAGLLGWSLIEGQLLEIVGLTSADRDHARRTLLAGMRAVLQPAFKDS